MSVFQRPRSTSSPSIQRRAGIGRITRANPDAASGVGRIANDRAQPWLPQRSHRCSPCAVSDKQLPAVNSAAYHVSVNLENDESNVSPFTYGRLEAGYRW